MKIIKTEDNQTVLDIAMQYYGTAEAIGEIISLNPNLKNAPLEVLNTGYEDVESLYLDIKLLENQPVNIDEKSNLMKKNVVKNINNPVTTYDNGTKY
jgi:phage tail protein X